MIDYLFVRLPAEISEPVFWASVLFSCFMIYYCVKEKKITVSLFALVFIVLMLSWRLVFLSKIISKRYSEIFIIPFVVYLAYSLYFICKKNAINHDKRSISSNIIKRLLYLFVFAVMVFIFLYEIVKTLHVDYYRLKVVNLYQLCNNKTTRNTDIFSNISNEETRRISFYSSQTQNTIIHDFNCNKESILSEIIPELYFFKDNIYFVIEDVPKNYYNSNNLRIPNGWGVFERIGSEVTSRKKRKEISVYRFVPSFRPTSCIDPQTIAPRNTIVFDSDNISVRGADSITFADQAFHAIGTNIILSSKEYIAVPPNNRLDMQVQVSNTGNVNTMFYMGYQCFDSNKKSIGSENYPYKNINRPLTVVSVQKSDNSIIVDSFSEWEKGCCIALNANEDLSDVPNLELLDGKISSLKKLSDERYQIIIDKPILQDIPVGTKIRINSIRGASLYTNAKLLLPGATESFSSSISKYETYHRFGSKGFSKGISFVKPIILSYSFNDKNPNSITITEFITRY